MDQTSLQDGGAIERLIGGKEVRANLEASKKYVLRATCISSWREKRAIKIGDRLNVGLS